MHFQTQCLPPSSPLRILARTFIQAVSGSGSRSTEWALIVYIQFRPDQNPIGTAGTYQDPGYGRGCPNEATQSQQSLGSIF